MYIAVAMFCCFAVAAQAQDLIVFAGELRTFNTIPEDNGNVLTWDVVDQNFESFVDPDVFQFEGTFNSPDVNVRFNEPGIQYLTVTEIRNSSSGCATSTTRALQIEVQENNMYLHFASLDVQDCFTGETDVNAPLQVGIDITAMGDAIPESRFPIDLEFTLTNTTLGAAPVTYERTLEYNALGEYTLEITDVEGDVDMTIEYEVNITEVHDKYTTPITKDQDHRLQLRIIHHLPNTGGMIQAMVEQNIIYVGDVYALNEQLEFSIKSFVFSREEFAFDGLLYSITTLYSQLTTITTKNIYNIQCLMTWFDKCCVENLQTKIWRFLIYQNANATQFILQQNRAECNTHSMNYIKYIGIICTILFLRIGIVYANDVPDLVQWPTYQILDLEPKQYTITGDQAFINRGDTVSTFTWSVVGGRLFSDAAGTNQVAADGASYVVTADNNATNSSTLWVRWNEPTMAGQTGYVYAYETTFFSCELEDDAPDKYSGVNVTIEAKPSASFIGEDAMLCASDDSISVYLNIDGLLPCNLTYTFDGLETTIEITGDDLEDLNGDDDFAEYELMLRGLSKYIDASETQDLDIVLTDINYNNVIDGDIEEPSTYNILVNPIPLAPVYSMVWDEVTQNVSHNFVVNEVVSAETFLWTLYDETGAFVNDVETTTETNTIDFTGFALGEYQLQAQYYDRTSGCLSYADTTSIFVFGAPQIFFSATTPDVDGVCSAVSFEPNETFQFLVEYVGARPYDFTYYLEDYEGNIVVPEVNIVEFTEQSYNIEIEHTFENSEDSDRVWVLKIVSATNVEGIDVEILDGERKITIHPKPVIIPANIDFYMSDK